YQRYQAVVFRAHFAGHLLEGGGCLGEAGQNSTMHVVAKTNAENRGNGQGNPLNKGILGRAVGIDATARPAVPSRPNAKSYESYGCSDSAPVGPAGNGSGFLGQSHESAAGSRRRDRRGRSGRIWQTSGGL